MTVSVTLHMFMQIIFEYQYGLLFPQVSNRNDPCKQVLGGYF